MLFYLLKLEFQWLLFNHSSYLCINNSGFKMLSVSDKTYHSKCDINRCIKTQEHKAAKKLEQSYRNIYVFIKCKYCAFLNNGMGKNVNESVKLNCCYTVVTTIVTFIKSEQQAKHLAFSNMQGFGSFFVLYTFNPFCPCPLSEIS